MLFASPVKAILVSQLKEHQGVAPSPLARDPSHEAIPSLLGLPTDPGREIDEAIREIREEVELRQKRGSIVAMPQGKDLQAEVQKRLSRPPHNA